MKATTMITAILLLGLVTPAFSASPFEKSFAKKKKKATLKLSDRSFAATVNVDEDDWLLKFYSPWCAHCIDFEPTWVKFVESVTTESTIQFGEVDGTVETRLSDVFQVNAFPKVIYVHQRKMHVFEGSRDVEALTEFIDGGWKEIAARALFEDPAILGSPPKKASVTEDALKPHKDDQLRLDMVQEELEALAKKNPDPEEAEENIPTSENLVTLDDSNFEVQTTNKNMWMIKFYAPWCHHCKYMQPEWIRFADFELEGISVGEMDATKSKHIAARFGVSSYPTILLLKDKKAYLYESERTAEGFVSFVTSGWNTATIVDEHKITVKNARRQKIHTLQRYFFLACACTTAIYLAYLCARPIKKGKVF